MPGGYNGDISNIRIRGSDVGVGATIVPLNDVPAHIRANGGYLLLDIGSIEFEARHVTAAGITGGACTVAALAFAHVVDDRCLWLTEPRLNVEYGGAKHDATTADSTAINRTITQANGIGGGVVYAPDGTYKIDAQLVMKSNVTLELAGNAVFVRSFDNDVKPDGATIKNEHAPLAAAYIVDPGPYVPPVYDTNIQIFGGLIKSTDAANEGPHICLYAVQNAKIGWVSFGGVYVNWNIALWGDDILVSGCHLDSGTTVLTDGIHAIAGSHIKIDNNYIKCGDDAIALGSNYNLALTDVAISNNTVYSQRGFAVTLVQSREGSTAAFGAATEYIERVSITNLVGRAGMLKHGLLRILQTGVADKTLIRDVSYSHVRLEAGDITGHDVGTLPWGAYLDGGLRLTFDDVNLINPGRSGFYLINSHDVKLNNCHVSGIQDAGSYRCVDTAASTDVNGLVITGSHFEHDKLVMYLKNAYNVVVSGNHLDGINNSQAGVYLDGASSYVTISGNIFTRLTGQTTSQGVRVASGSTVNSLTITGNDFGYVDVPILFSAVPASYRVEGNTNIGVKGLTAADATPSVAIYKVFKTANVGATTIIDFDDGYPTQEIMVLIGDAFTTIDFTASGLKGNAGADWSPASGDYLTAVYDGSDWFCEVHDCTA